MFPWIQPDLSSLGHGLPTELHSPHLSGTPGLASAALTAVCTEAGPQSFSATSGPTLAHHT